MPPPAATHVATAPVVPVAAGPADAVGVVEQLVAQPGAASIVDQIVAVAQLVAQQAIGGADDQLVVVQLAGAHFERSR